MSDIIYRYSRVLKKFVLFKSSECGSLCKGCIIFNRCSLLETCSETINDKLGINLESKFNTFTPVREVEFSLISVSYFKSKIEL